MRKQPYAVIVVCLLLLILPAMAAQAESTDVTDEIKVEGWPEPLVLGFGDTTEFTITVRNTGDRTLNVFLSWLSCKCPYGHSGSVSDSFFTLGPGDAKNVEVSVTSGSRFMGDNDGEGMLRFEWGPEMTMVDDRPDDMTVEGAASLEIDVQTDPTTTHQGLLAVILVIAIGIMGGVLIFRKVSGRNRGSE